MHAYICTCVLSLINFDYRHVLVPLAAAVTTKHCENIGVHN